MQMGPKNSFYSNTQFMSFKQGWDAWKQKMSTTNMEFANLKNISSIGHKLTNS